MYAGHLAVGLLIKSRVPRAPTWALLVGVGLLDLVFGVLVLAGVERVRITPGVAPGFALESIAWSHSLAASLAWSLLFALCFHRHGRAVVAAVAISVFSHFVLDYVMHPGDLRFAPGIDTPLGLGLWRRLPTGWWLCELIFVASCCGRYLLVARSDKSFGGRAAWAVAVVLAFHVANAPWLSPVR